MDRVKDGAVLIGLVVSLAVAGARIGGVTHTVYQAVAHVWVGMLLAFWLAGGYGPEAAGGGVAKWLFWALCAVEVVCAVAARV
jgi:hypothetical protein